MGKIQTWLSGSATRFNQLFARFKRFARKALFVVGIVCGVAVASMLCGLAVDTSPASHIGIGPDWQSALSDPTWWGVAEKLFTCMAVGYMFGILPGGLLALLTAGWIGARRETMADAEQANYFLEELFDLVDHDRDGKIQDMDLIAFLPHAFHNERSVCQYILQNRARIGRVEVLPDGTATYSITPADLGRHPAQERERLVQFEWAAMATILVLAVVAFTMGMSIAVGLLLFAEAVTFYFLLKRKVRLQRFIQREFSNLDANSDGLVDELEIVKLWPKLAESERLMLTKLHNRIGEYGHDVLRDGVTIRGITRLEIDTCVPTFARMIV